MGEVLYMEAWGDAAAQVSSLLERGKVYRVQGARIMPQMPRFSTSRLDYYLRAVQPIGMKTKFKEVAVTPWNELPLHHPFTKLSSLEKVETTLQVCLLGIVTHQLGGRFQGHPVRSATRVQRSYQASWK